MNVIQTDRLLLAHLTIEDAPFIFELLNTPEWLQPKPIVPAAPAQVAQAAPAAQQTAQPAAQPVPQVV